MNRLLKPIIYKLITFSVLFIPGFYFSITLKGYLPDENAYLQTVNRMMNGDLLYRDIFAHVTPLSYYITLLFTRLVGLNILVIKFINTVIFVFTVLITINILKKLTAIYITYTLLVIATLFAYAVPGDMGAGGIYNSLAILVFMICFNITITWHSTESGDRVNWKMKNTTILIMLGMAAGLCLLAKQNIGCLAFVSILLSIVTLRYPFGSKQYLREICYVSVTFVATVTIGFLTIWLNDAVEFFWEYSILSQIVYVEKATISYIGGINTLGRLVFNEPNISYREIGGLMLYLLGPITFVMYLISYLFLSQKDKKRHIIIFWFLISGLILIFPRADLAHVSMAAPVFTIGIIYAWHIIKSQLHIYSIYLLRILLILWLGCWMRYLAGDFIYFTSSRMQISSIPYFRGLIVPKTWHKQTTDLIEEIRKTTNGEKTLILSWDSAIIYLSGNITNPTPFDWYAVNGFGIDGERKVIDLIKSDKIKFVYIKPFGLHPLAPSKLEQYVLDECTLVVNLNDNGLGYIYSFP